MPPVPSRRRPDIFDFLPRREFIESVARLLSSAEAVEDYCRKVPPYEQEAVIQAVLRPSDANPLFPLPGVAELDLGIHPRHPLYVLREDLVESVERFGSTNEAGALLLWGATVRKGKPLFREVALLARFLPLHWRARLFGRPTLDVVGDWLAASGVVHMRTLAAAMGVAREVLANRHPRESYIPLDYEAVKLALRLAEGDRRLAYLVFSCLSRIAAYRQPDNTVRWRSQWLRGAKADPRAIPGASGPQKRLKELLHSHVLRRLQPHQAGRKAATYEVLVELRPGDWDMERTAARFMLRIDERGVPRGLIE